MATGDYTVIKPDLTRLLTIERKEINDLVSCWGKHRKRFEAELMRMKAYRYRFVVVEASYQEILEGNYQSSISTEIVINSIAAWQARGINFVLADSRQAATHFSYQIMKTIAKDINFLAQKIVFDTEPTK